MRYQKFFNVSLGLVAFAAVIAAVYLWYQNSTLHLQLSQRMDYIDQQSAKASQEKSILHAKIVELHEDVASARKLPTFRERGVHCGYFYGDDALITEVNSDVLQQFVESEFFERHVVSAVDILICPKGANGIAFSLFYGNRYTDKEYNAVIGFFDGVDAKFATTRNHGGGDSGICMIDAFLQDTDFLYSCGGGDGPSGHHRLYYFNSDTGDSRLLSDCRFNSEEGYPDEKCVVRL